MAAGSCGGLRCLGGNAHGTPCTIPGSGDPVCVSGTCDRLGEPTASNWCTSGSCTTAGGDEGVCASGPFYGHCSPAEPFQGCLAESDCTMPGDTCVFTAQECFPDNGVIGMSVTATGIGDEPTAGIFHPTVAGLACFEPTGFSFSDAALGLPGPARATLEIDALLE
jgi:hypothetical protein